VEVPPNAFLDYYGHDWECKRGYKRSGARCIPIQVPPHAFLDYTGHDWECERGYRRVGDACQAVFAASSTRRDHTLAKHPESDAIPEHSGTKYAVRQLQQQLKQAGYDPGPIDGILGPRTLEALRRYLAAQKRLQVDATPARPRRAVETRG
jgi:hypothetical protein